VNFHQKEPLMTETLIPKYLASNNVHKLKHKISLLGLEESYALANQHELNLKEGNNTLHNNFSAILDTMAQFLDEV
jgi:HPt (histidine-containing phosphotransfer) domain-containing protein